MHKQKMISIILICSISFGIWIWTWLGVLNKLIIKNSMNIFFWWRQNNYCYVIELNDVYSQQFSFKITSRIKYLLLMLKDSKQQLNFAFHQMDITYSFYNIPISTEFDKKIYRIFSYFFGKIVYFSGFFFIRRNITLYTSNIKYWGIKSGILIHYMILCCILCQQMEINTLIIIKTKTSF